MDTNHNGSGYQNKQSEYSTHPMAAVTMTVDIRINNQRIPLTRWFPLQWQWISKQPEYYIHPMATVTMTVDIRRHNQRIQISRWFPLQWQWISEATNQSIPLNQWMLSQWQWILEETIRVSQSLNAFIYNDSGYQKKPSEYLTQ